MVCILLILGLLILAGIAENKYGNENDGTFIIGIVISVIIFIIFGILVAEYGAKNVVVEEIKVTEFRFLSDGIIIINDKSYEGKDIEIIGGGEDELFSITTSTNKNRWIFPLDLKNTSYKLVLSEAFVKTEET